MQGMPDDALASPTDAGIDPRKSAHPNRSPRFPRPRRDNHVPITPFNLDTINAEPRTRLGPRKVGTL